MRAIDPTQLSEIADRYAPALILYARQWCETPEDVVQEAFLSLIRQSEPPQNLVGWLYRVVRNAAISAARSSSRRKRHENEAGQTRSPWFETSKRGPVDPTEATAALQRLPVEEREIVVARIWGELSFEQLAELTQTSLSTVRRRYLAALESMKENWNEPPRSTPMERTKQ